MRVGGGDQRSKFDPLINKVSDKKKVGKQDKKAEAFQTSDSVEFSSESRLVLNARKAMEDLPVIRVEKVIPISKSIKEGSYEIKDEETAEKMVDDTLKDELL